ncbi:MAG: hypothetical protein JWO72_927 [Caulobacteraceae bacterium]|nr:hypothetical protein [Caulobacteraceae bacterium]
MTRSTLLAAAAASLLALPAVAWGQDHARPAPPVAPPAAAGTPSGAWTLEVREDWLIGRLHRALEEHDIDGSEAERVYQEVGRMRDLAKRISQRHGGALTAGETAAQQGRLDTLASQIHWLRENAFQRPW